MANWESLQPETRAWIRDKAGSLDQGRAFPGATGARQPGYLQAGNTTTQRDRLAADHGAIVSGRAGVVDGAVGTQDVATQDSTSTNSYRAGPRIDPRDIGGRYTALQDYLA